MRNRKPEVSKKEKQNQRRGSSRHGGGLGADPRVCPGSWTRAGETRGEPWCLGAFRESREKGTESEHRGQSEKEGTH